MQYVGEECELHPLTHIFTLANSLPCYSISRGYLQSCRDIVTAAKTIETAIRDEIPELQILGKPVASVVAFRSRLVNVLQVGDFMRKRGWHLNALQGPAAVHIACTVSVFS